MQGGSIVGDESRHFAEKIKAVSTDMKREFFKIVGILIPFFKCRDEYTLYTLNH